jgi:hypothetical protein
MNTLERRVRKAEERTRIDQPTMTMAQIDARLDELLAEWGTSLSEVVAHYGSLGSFARALEAQ